jgi:hypothetical protein
MVVVNWRNAADSVLCDRSSLCDGLADEGMPTFRITRSIPLQIADYH